MAQGQCRPHGLGLLPAGYSCWLNWPGWSLPCAASHVHIHPKNGSPPSICTPFNHNVESKPFRHLKCFCSCSLAESNALCLMPSLHKLEGNGETYVRSNGTGLHWLQFKSKSPQLLLPSIAGYPLPLATGFPRMHPSLELSVPFPAASSKLESAPKPKPPCAFPCPSFTHRLLVSENRARPQRNKSSKTKQLLYFPPPLSSSTPHRKTICQVRDAVIRCMRGKANQA